MFHKKQIFKLNILRQLLTDEKSCVSLVSTSRLLALPPFFLNDMKSGILYILNAMLKKYDRSLGGIVIGYQNIKVLMDENTGIIPIGTSETEVNISVEFYIFQPKIGNYLEGVINKKSNNHIGCLVHQYFNATILKPEDVDYDDWICKDFSVDDKVTFKVKDLDFTTLLPYIEGIVEDKNSGKNSKRNVKSDVDNVIMNHVNEISENDSLFSKNLFKNTSSKDKKFLENKKAKNRNEEEVSVLEDSINTSSGEFKSFTSPKKKEKRKKEKIDLELDVHNKTEEERSSKDQELTLGSFSNKYNMEESHSKKKKKKKDKNKQESDDQVLNAVTNSRKEEDPMMSFLEKCSQVENENSDDFVKEGKSKKVKKKKKKKDEKDSLDFNKTSTCLPVEEMEDNMFYSTQLEQVSERKKMNMPYFSPILPFDKKRDNEMTTPNLDCSAHLHNEKESQEKEKKKKHKKRKAEEKDESAGEPAPKKMKTSDTSKKKEPQVAVNGVDVKSDTQISMEEMYKKLLKEAREQINVSDKESSKAKKKKKESKHREKKASQSELLKNAITQVNGSEEKSEVQSILDKLLEDEMKRVKENLNASDSERSRSLDKSKTDKQEKKLLKERSKNSSLKAGKRSKTSLGDINGQDKKFDVHHGS